MGIINSLRDRARALERENIALRRDLERAQATTEYLAMMADIDIDEEEENDAQQDV